MEKIITDELLTDALKIYEANMLSNLPQHDIIPSKKFERRMERMIKSQSGIYYRMTCTRARRAIAIAAAVAILIASVMSVGAVREAIFNFFVSRSANVDYIEYNTEAESYPAELSSKYSPEYIPEGYELSDEYSDATTALELYTCGDNYLKIQQFVKGVYVAASDNEFSQIKTRSKDGADYIIRTDGDGAYMIVFEKYGYVFELVGFLPEDEMLKIAGSIGGRL